MTTTDQNPTEADYFRYEEQAHRAMVGLKNSLSSARRAAFLADLAEHEWHQSTLHTAVFGYDIYSEEDPTTQAEWLADSARMLWIVAQAELCRSRGREGVWPPAEWLAAQDERTKQLVAHASVPLELLASGYPPRRPLRRLPVLWAQITRGQAVESLACIPLPRCVR